MISEKDREYHIIEERRIEVKCLQEGLRLVCRQKLFALEWQQSIEEQYKGINKSQSVKSKAAKGGESDDEQAVHSHEVDDQYYLMEVVD